MDTRIENKINRLQDNLQTIRLVGGWTAEEFGDMIGVTKQTISNLENKRTAMTKTVYIAIRAVLDAEINENHEDSPLANMVHLLLDSEELSEEAQEKAKNAAAYAASARRLGLGTAAITTGITALMGILFPTTALIGLTGITSSWLLQIINDKNKK